MDNAYIALPTTSSIAAVLATAIGVEGFDSAVTIPVAESAFAIKTPDNAIALPARKPFAIADVRCFSSLAKFLEAILA